MIPHHALSAPAAERLDDVDGVAARIAALVDPLAYCPGCLAGAGTPWPAGATTQHCPRCLGRLRRRGGRPRPALEEGARDER